MTSARELAATAPEGRCPKCRRVIHPLPPRLLLDGCCGRYLFERASSRPLRVVVTRRPDDWHAHVEGDPCMWDCGPTPEHAVKELRRGWPEAAGAEIVLKLDEER